MGAVAETPPARGVEHTVRALGVLIARGRTGEGPIRIPGALAVRVGGQVVVRV